MKCHKSDDELKSEFLAELNQCVQELLEPHIEKQIEIINRVNELGEFINVAKENFKLLNSCVSRLMEEKDDPHKHNTTEPKA